MATTQVFQDWDSPHESISSISRKTTRKTTTTKTRRHVYDDEDNNDEVKAAVYIRVYIYNLVHHRRRANETWCSMSEWENLWVRAKSISYIWFGLEFHFIGNIRVYSGELVVKKIRKALMFLFLSRFSLWLKGNILPIDS